MVTAVRVELTRGVLNIHFALFKGVPTVQYSASNHCQETVSMFCPIKLTRMESHSVGCGVRTHNSFLTERCLKKKLLYVSFGSAVRTGFEPVNSTVTGWHDNQLHQRTII